MGRRRSEKRKEERIRIEYEPLSKVVKWPKNPKQHDMDTMGQSIDRFGFVQPLTKDEGTGKLVAGHGRVQRLEEMKAAGEEPPRRIVVEDDEWLVPVVRGISFRNEVEAQAYVVADNRTVELGGWNERMLTEVLSGLVVVEDGLMGIGYDKNDLDALIAFSSMEDEEVPNMDEFLQPSKVHRVIIACDNEDQLKAVHKFLGLKYTSNKISFGFSETKVSG